MDEAVTLPTYPSRTVIGSRSGFRSSRLRHRGIEAQLQSTGSQIVYTDKGHFELLKSSLSYSTVVAKSIFLDRFYPTLHVPEARFPRQPVQGSESCATTNLSQSWWYLVRISCGRPLRFVTLPIISLVLRT